MDANKKQALLDKLTYIVTNTSDLSLFNTANPPTMRLWVGDRGVYLIGEALEEYYAANLARDGLQILAMTLTDTLSPRSIGKIFLSSAQIVVVSGFFQ
jgi:hypothetical protein